MHWPPHRQHLSRWSPSTTQMAPGGTLERQTAKSPRRYWMQCSVLSMIIHSSSILPLRSFILMTIGPHIVSSGLILKLYVNAHFFFSVCFYQLREIHRETLYQSASSIICTRIFVYLLQLPSATRFQQLKAWSVAVAYLPWNVLLT